MAKDAENGRVRVMRKEKIGLYMSESAIAWLERFPPQGTKSGSVGFIAEWAVRQLRKGAIQAFRALDSDERAAILQCKPSPETEALAAKVREWFELDRGQLLGWDAAKKEALIEKLEAFTPAQALGLACWAAGERDSEDASILF